MNLDIVFLQSFLFFLREYKGAKFSDILKIFGLRSCNANCNLCKFRIYCIQFLNRFDVLVGADIALKKKDCICVLDRKTRKLSILFGDISKILEKLGNNIVAAIDTPFFNLASYPQNIPLRFSEYILRKVGIKFLPVNWKSIRELSSKATNISKKYVVLETFPNVFRKRYNICEKSDVIDAKACLITLLKFLNREGCFVFGEILVPLKIKVDEYLLKTLLIDDSSYDLILQWFKEYSRKYLTKS